MIRFLNYIIFHFIEFQKKVGNNDVSIFTTSVFFTIMIWMNILTAINYILMKNYYPTTNYIIPVALFCIGLFWIINNYIRKRKYESYIFHTSFLGYIYLFLYISISFVLFVNSVELIKK
ncbi:hypothetical protein ACM46_16960 [Chryseobacterium angstadtii]|uniref:Uncharacterized protein n=1 Tax=Chryseobacterium angstadtii TaxID=558151 RepID=A0A0J7I1Q5_9FLAO|nr:hypothetical protein ACM46_16960 [Chryseobacterium angstadtii]